MSKILKFLLVPGMLLCAVFLISVVHSETRFNIGHSATTEQIAGWDIDIRPDGFGLPEGSGSVESGEMLYEEKCASCHGVFGEGEDRWPVIAGGIGTLMEEKPEKTVGSYWPYVSTLWDYIHRAMPFLEPQSLTDNEVYALTAYVLYLNDQVDEDFVLTKHNLPTITLPNEKGFFIDPRPEALNSRCMTNCLTTKQMSSWSAADLGVTPLEHLSNLVPATAQDDLELRETNTLAIETYKKACVICHDTGVAGAPIFGDKEDWRQRAEKGLEVLYQNALNGYLGEKGYMPAKGGNSGLTDESVKAAVDHMLRGGLAD